MLRLTPLRTFVHGCTLLVALAATSGVFAQTYPTLNNGTKYNNVLDGSSSPALTVFNSQLVVAYQDNNTKKSGPSQLPATSMRAA